MTRYDYYQPESLEEAFRFKKDHPKALYISGGTDLMVRIKKKELHPSALVSLRSIDELSGIENSRVIRIGAGTTISYLLKNPWLHEKYPVLIQAAHTLGSGQIRNVATIGGNLCNGSPAADMAPPLLVLEAKVRLQDDKKSREISLEKLFLGPGKSCLAPGEILNHILLATPQQDTKSIFLKKGRTRMDLAVASAAVLIRNDGKRFLKARVAVGSVAPTPLRLFAVENLLEGALFSQDLLNKAQRLASRSVSPITDIRSTAEYRRHLVGVLIRRALEELLAGDSKGKNHEGRGHS